MIMIFWH